MVKVKVVKVVKVVNVEVEVVNGGSHKASGLGKILKKGTEMGAIIHLKATL